jgi:hypothetical protein
MSRRATRDARLVRGLVVAASGAGLSVGGHLAAGGGLPDQPAVFMLIILAAAGCTVLSDREWSFRRLLVAVGGVEILTHLSMGLGHGSMPHPAGAQPGPGGWLMLAAHTAAALLTAWGLRSGEAMYWRIVDHLRRGPLPRTVALRVASDLRIPAQAEPAGLESLQYLADALSRRGPPSLVA